MFICLTSLITHNIKMLKFYLYFLFSLTFGMKILGLIGRKEHRLC